jgi:hypothetical protein
MQSVVGIALLVVGVVLIIFGMQASASLGSRLSELFTGAPSDRTIWLLVVGVVAAIVGLGLLLTGRRGTPTSPRCKSGWDTPTLRRPGSTIAGRGGRRRVPRLRWNTEQAQKNNKKGRVAVGRLSDSNGAILAVKELRLVPQRVLRCQKTFV